MANYMILKERPVSEITASDVKAGRIYFQQNRSSELILCNMEVPKFTLQLLTTGVFYIMTFNSDENDEANRIRRSSEV